MPRVTTNDWRQKGAKPMGSTMQVAGQVHNLDCKSNLGAMLYDQNCLRCSKIKRVVYLRRKTTKNGASIGEETLALEQAERLRLEFRLTRGEIFDRQYEEAPTIKVQAQHFKSSAPTYNNAVNPNAKAKYKYRKSVKPEDLTQADLW